MLNRDANGNFTYAVTIASKQMADGRTEWYGYQTGTLAYSKDYGSKSNARKAIHQSILADCGHDNPTIYWTDAELEPQAPMAERAKMTIKGQEYEVPSQEELQEWLDDCGCETPDGDWVEPDCPTGWLSILGLI